MTVIDTQAEVIQHGFIELRVCVPEDWTDNDITAYAEETNPCGTETGWMIRTAADRIPCPDSKFGFVHVILDV